MKNRSNFLKGKIKNIFRPEDYIFLIFITIFTAIYLLTGDYSLGRNFMESLVGQVHEFGNSFKWIYLSLIIFMIFLYITIMHNVLFALARRRAVNINVKAKIKKFFYLAKYVILFTITLTAEFVAVSRIYDATQSRLMNEEFFNFEKNLFGVMPFIEVHNEYSILKAIFDPMAPLILACFFSISAAISIAVAYLLIREKKELLIKYTIAFFVGSLLAMPIWFAFPINSPNNYYLDGNVRIENFKPNETFVKITDEIRERQKEYPPITTFPSMHTYWALISVYFLTRANKKWLFVGVPWFLLLYLGTFYFAQHYAIDGLLSIIMAIPIIYFVEKYYPWLEKKIDRKSSEKKRAT